MTVLVAHPQQAPVVRAVADALPLAAICNPWRTRFGDLPVPVHSDLRSLLAEHEPEAVIVLRPYSGLESDLVLCEERQIRVLCAGPVALPPSPLRQWGGQSRHTPVITQALAQSRQPAFGQPVYLRRVAGGGGALLQSWWSACQLLDEAQALLGAPPIWVQLAAVRAAAKHHLVLTAAFANGANAHLVVSPYYFSPSTDLTLLGSGGLLFADTATNTPVAVHAGGSRFYQPASLYPEPAWIGAFLTGQDPPVTPSDAALHHRLFAAIRQALRCGLPVPVLP
ncbi:MAG: hypothetical protein IT369_24405 [Candidatus Latescibacteria bacterium]|nr:hypothetical protein [Candidatus Latescibacterota bacterium]